MTLHWGFAVHRGRHAALFVTLLSRLALAQPAPPLAGDPAPSGEFPVGSQTSAIGTKRSCIGTEPVNVGDLNADRPGVVRGGISKGRLSHRPPKLARQEFDKGQQASRNGRTEEARQHFAAAVQADPGYWEAHVKLADVYWRRSEASEALDQLDAALRIDSNSRVLLVNKALALLKLNRPAEAEAAGRQALRLEPASTGAHAVVAMALLDQDRITPETASHLSVAATEFPQFRDAYRRVQERLSGRAQPKTGKAQARRSDPDAR